MAILISRSGPRQRGIGHESNQRAVRTIAREREVCGRVSSCQVKVDDVASGCDLKEAAGPAGLRKGRSRGVGLLADEPDLARSNSSDTPKSLIVPSNASCSRSSQPAFPKVRDTEAGFCARQQHNGPRAPRQQCRRLITPRMSNTLAKRGDFISVPVISTQPRSGAAEV